MLSLTLIKKITSLTNFENRSFPVLSLGPGGTEDKGHGMGYGIGHGIGRGMGHWMGNGMGHGMGHRMGHRMGNGMGHGMGNGKRETGDGRQEMGGCEI